MTREPSDLFPHGRGPGPQPRSGLSGVFTAGLHQLAQWISGYAVMLLTLAAGLIPAVLLTLGSADVYRSVSESNGVAQLDQPLLDAALAMRSPELNTAVTVLTNLAGTVGMPILTVAAMAILASKWRSWTPVLVITAAAAGSLLMTVTGKELVGRTRPSLADAVPPYESSPSFPSGHSLNSVVIAGAVAYLIILHLDSRRMKVLTIVLAASFAVAVGMSRVFLGHHWFTDVLVAWTLGLAWLAVVITAHRLLQAPRRARKNAAAGGT